jgi:hypothetical protein
VFPLRLTPTRTPLGWLSRHAVAMTCPTLSRLAVARPGVPPELVAAGSDPAGPRALPALLPARPDLARAHTPPKLARAGPDRQTVRSGVGGRATRNRRQRKPLRWPLRRPRERRDGTADETHAWRTGQFSESPDQPRERYSKADTTEVTASPKPAQSATEAKRTMLHAATGLIASAVPCSDWSGRDIPCCRGSSIA